MRAAVVAVLLLLATSSALVLSAAPAAAHGGDSAGVPAFFRTTVTSVTPGVEGLRVRSVERGARLQVTYDGPGVVEVLGDSGEPYLRLTSAGTETNLDSPSSWRDDDRLGATEVPADADGRGRPRWVALGEEPVLTWQEHRAHWTGLELPEQVQAEPGEARRVRDWTVPLVVDGAPVTVVGTLD